MRFTKSKVSFKVRAKPYEFIIYHTMPKTKGLSFNEALSAWIAKTKIYSPNNLVKFILARQKDVLCMTEDNYDKTFGDG